MSIVRRDFPTATAPSSVTDYQRQNTLIDKLMMKSQQIWHYGGSYYLPKGLVFYHGGTVYEVTANEAISGSFSRYITVTKSVDGSTCTAAFVASMTGITWNDSYNGYYDASGNLVFIDEFSLANAGTIAAPKGLFGWLGKILKDLSSALYIGNSLDVGSSITADGGISATGAIGSDQSMTCLTHLTGYQNFNAGWYSVGLYRVMYNHSSNIIEFRNGVTVDMAGAILAPSSGPTSGSQAILTTATWTPPRGVYVISCPAAIRVKTSGSTSAADFNGGTLFADGTKVGLYNSSLGTVTVYYEKF